MGSPLQPFMAQLILTMLHSLVPFDLLDFETYAKYYESYIDQHIIITSNLPYIDSGFQNLEQRNSYHTNAHKIWCQMYMYLFCTLLGSYKSTRYQHMLTFTSEFYCHNAYVLQCTPRALYGTDAGEHYNDKIKSLVHRMSNKFRSLEKNRIPPSTIKQIMQYCLWEYYEKRENSEELNTNKLQEKLKEHQQLKDDLTLTRVLEVCEYFKNNNVKFKLNLKQFDILNHEYNKKHQPLANCHTEKKRNSSECKSMYDTSSSESSDQISDEFDREFRYKLQGNLDGIQRFIRQQRDMDKYFNDKITEEICMW